MTACVDEPEQPVAWSRGWNRFNLQKLFLKVPFAEVPYQGNRVLLSSVFDVCA